MAASLLVLLQLMFVVQRPAPLTPPAGGADKAAAADPHAGHQMLIAAAGAGAALIFNGTNSYVRVTDSATLRIPVNLTVEAWSGRTPCRPVTATSWARTITCSLSSRRGPASGRRWSSPAAAISDRCSRVNSPSGVATATALPSIPCTSPPLPVRLLVGFGWVATAGRRRDRVYQLTGVRGAPALPDRAPTGAHRRAGRPHRRG
jgi:hypothetical protein